MKAIDYTYAVARIRVLEMSLLSNAVIEQLLSCKTAAQCMQLLAEKGWGSPETAGDADAMLKREEQKTWEVIRELAPEEHTLDVLTYARLYHNLKAAVKELCTEVGHENIYYDDCAISGAEMLEILKNKEFSRLPGAMAETAREAYFTLLQTRDGQLCDVIVDKGALEAVYAAAKASRDELIRSYGEAMTAISDIKIAVRSQKTGKSLEFIQRALAECDSIDTEKLAHMAVRGEEELLAYLEDTPYAGGTEALRESPEAFERWCDNYMIEMIKPQKSNPFTVGPLAAYVLARENEIKTVRIILTGKQNHFPEEAVRERIREMYV